jgi:hypothetical protein
LTHFFLIDLFSVGILSFLINLKIFLINLNFILIFLKKTVYQWTRLYFDSLSVPCFKGIIECFWCRQCLDNNNTQMWFSFQYLKYKWNVDGWGNIHSFYKLYNKNIEKGNSQVNGIFSCHPFSPGANKYLHIDQIYYVKTRIKFSSFAKKSLLVCEIIFQLVRKLFCKKANLFLPWTKLFCKSAKSN